ncbi:MAG: SDR family oxidoreductase [Bacteroidota bacterium]
MNLENKVAIITGATGGIGKATAYHLDKAGMKLVLTGRSQDKLDQLAEEMTDAVGVSGDIVDPLLSQRLLDVGIEKYGKVDVLFNNAGIMIVSDLENTDIEAMCHMVRVNVESMARMAFTLLKHFISNKSGFLINTSSISGLKTSPGTAAYSASKFAVEAFSDTIRQDLAPYNQKGSDIRVACIQPGPVATNLMNDFPSDVKEYMTSMGVLRPEDIARTVQFVLEQPKEVVIPRMLVLPSSFAF